MRRVLRIIGIVLGVLIGVVVVAGAGVALLGTAKLNKTYAFAADTVAIPTDAASIERGQHLTNAVVGCTGCHTANLGGEVFLDIPPARLIAPNLTSGAGGVGKTYTDADWVRALRHGVNRDGKSLIIMPSESLAHLSDADLGAIIAYIKTAPPVDSQLPTRNVALLGKVLVGLNQFPLQARLIDHTQRPPVPAASRTAEYGSYLTTVGSCRDCHTPNLAGGPPNDPSEPAAPNITSGSELAGWSETDFIKAMRTGITPSNRQLSDAMPWKAYGQMTDDELTAVMAYLRIQPKLPTNKQ